MRKILPILLTAIIFLTPLYPVYALDTTSARAAASSSAKPKLPPGLRKIEDNIAKKEESLMMKKDKMASRSAMLREKLTKFKDKVKARRVESINDTLNDINKRRVNQMVETLARISEFLERLKAKTAEAKNNGKDVGDIEVAIVDAEKAWSEASALLKTQLEKDYTISVNTEKTVKDDASVARDSLKNDLQEAHQKVVVARKALVDVIQIVLSKLGGKNGE